MPPRERQKLSKIGDSDNFRDIMASFNARRFNRPDEMYQNQGQNVGSNLFNINLTRPSDNSGIMSVADNRTSRNPNTWPNSKYWGIGGFDFVKDHAPEYLDYFQEIKDKDAMARDAGFYPYVNPSWIENEPSYGLDYMMDIFGGKGQLGFRGDVDDDKWNAYAKWGIEL